MTFAGIMTLLSLGLGAIKVLTWGWDKFFSDSATLRRLQANLEQRRVALVEARARLARQEAEIEAQPPKTEQALAEELNKRLKDLK